MFTTPSPYHRLRVGHHALEGEWEEIDIQVFELTSPKIIHFEGTSLNICDENRSLKEFFTIGHGLISRHVPAGCSCYVLRARVRFTDPSPPPAGVGSKLSVHVLSRPTVSKAGEGEEEARVRNEKYQGILSGIARVHADCITIDGTVASFLPPLDLKKMTDWWAKQAADEDRTVIYVSVTSSSSTSSLASSMPTANSAGPESNPPVQKKQKTSHLSTSTTTTPATPNSLETTSSGEANGRKNDGEDKEKENKEGGGEEEEEVAGVVVLFAPGTETGPFRGWVEKLLVSPRFRRMGIARLLMTHLEEVGARDKGVSLLMLDTISHSPAEQVYPRLGYKRLGLIAGYSINPLDITGPLKDEVFFYKDLRTEKRGEVLN